MSSLIWNFVSGGEWQAGGLSRHFTITRIGGDRYSLTARTGDNPAIAVGVFGSLRGAKMRAQAILDNGVARS